ncbi:MAG TPA: DMT family transporter [Thermoanaerobaculia bacterium]|nr:DMT family transporter [Thermoanaerobaculia bacterium]
MTNSLPVLLVAVAAGVAVALQGQAMGAMNRSAGTATTTFVTYGSGALIACVIWLLRRTPSTAPLPWYGWTAGALGLVIVGGIAHAAPRIGLSRTLVITVAAQLLAALAIETFGWMGSSARPIDAGKLAGIALTIAGVWLVVR